MKCRYTDIILHTFCILGLVSNIILHGLYSPPNLVRVMKSISLRWAGHVARMEEGRSSFKILIDKPIGKRPLGRPRRRWKDNIRMDLEEIDIDTGELG